MPAEWIPHQSTWLSCPKDPETWPDRVPQVEEIYLQMIAALAPYEIINLLVNDLETEQIVRARCGPAIAASDYMRVFADQVRPFIKRTYRVLGTDGFGRSDFRKQLRRFFEVDRYYVALAALKALADDGTIAASVVAQAIKKYKLDPEKPYPPSV